MRVTLGRVRPTICAGAASLHPPVRERAAAGAITAAGTAIVTLAQVARVKVFAVALGVAGTGLVAQVSSVQGLLLTLAPLSSGVALITVLAPIDARSDAFARTVGAARGLALMVTVPIATLAGVAGLAGALVLGDELGLIVAIGCVGVPFGALAATEQGVLQAVGRISGLAMANVATAVIAFALVGGLAVLGGPVGASLGLSLGLAVGWAVTFAMSNHYARGGGIRFDRQVTRSLAHVGVGALSATTVAIAAQALIRAQAFILLGAAAVGLVHALVALALQFSYFAGTALGTYAQPRIAAAVVRGEHGEVAREIREVRWIGGGLVGMSMVVAALVADPLVRLLLSDEFLPVATLLPLQLVGEVFRIYTWLSGMYLLPMGFRRVFVGVELVVVCIFLPVALVLAPSSGIAAFSLAHVVSAAAAAALIAVHAGRSLRLAPTAGAGPLALAGVGLMAIAAGERTVGMAAIPLIAGMALWRWRSVRAHT